jgi:hypothetical protein
MNTLFSDEEIQERINSPLNTLVVSPYRKSTERGPDVPIEIKKTIAILSQEESCKDLAELFNLSPSSVVNYKAGRNHSSLDDNSNSEIVEVKNEKKDALKEAKESIEASAINGVLQAVGLVGPMISGIKDPTKLVRVAKDLAGLADSVRGERPEDREKSVHVHLYAPTQKKLEDYNVIDV